MTIKVQSAVGRLDRTRRDESCTCNICKNFQDILAAMWRGPGGKNAR